ncbi:phosphodiesterase [Rubripirellula obstinata]|uniref:Phosphodiesterase n=1 Tax=Rubripirellula obstinata TaxID=406547 RepID=A0A5B1CSG4_9BACT|nr:HDIG domain-containing metalloprotein [Rubripirellula obstinata]KAA1262154.1 phosphodiesterase [Rubripirellula obstinata]
MSGQSKPRNRQERIDSLGIQKPRLIQWWQDANKTDVFSRVGIAITGALLLLVLCQSWRPPFAYRVGAIPARDLVSRVTFEVPNIEETKAIQNTRRRETLAFYRNRTEPLKQLQAALRDQLFLVLSESSYEELTEEEKLAFSQFYDISQVSPPAEGKTLDTPAMRFAMLKDVLSEDKELKKLQEALDIAMKKNFEKGVILNLTHKPDQGSKDLIQVYRAGLPDEYKPVDVSDVRIAEASLELVKQLKEQFRTRFSGEESKTASTQKVAQMIGDWIVTRLKGYETLQYDDERSEQARKEAAALVEPVMTPYRFGESQLAEAGKPLATKEIGLLEKEWVELIGKMTLSDKLARVAAYGGMIAALYLLCGSYIFFVDDRSLLLDRWKLGKVLAVVVGAIVLGYWVSGDRWRGELIPLVMASIVLSVVYGRELALLLMAAACISTTLFLGSDLAELVSMAAACTSCILLLGRIRTRTHLLYVGAVSGLITLMTVVGVGIVTGQTLSAGALGSGIEPVYRGPQADMVFWGLLKEAMRSGVYILVSSLAMTGLLPLVEKAFGVQTDLSLLELGDASHPLLRRLAQRAPGTYNHSINVASIAEAAADSIGANGLLVRVGAYFHDIGKMFKPEYFIENQSAGVNQHDSLQPAMSTLVIIAHVKDGADLARSHHLPEPIIDFILQHHGTTLVEYFYREAARRSEEDPNGESVSDKDFRYPGPKPQTLEAAVMMLADTVESASRTLVDPTPSRITNLVESISNKKMGDGQFDECGLTFKQLDRVRRSLVKSLTAIYHARVKYPGQQSA